MDKPYIVFRPTPRYEAAFTYACGTVESETAKRVTLNQGPARYIQPRQIVARFPTDQEVAFLVQAINGARGEYENRERRAHAACIATIAYLIDRACK